jgi:hypothetical protein
LTVWPLGGLEVNIGGQLQNELTLRQERVHTDFYQRSDLRNRGSMLGSDSVGQRPVKVPEPSGSKLSQSVHTALGFGAWIPKFTEVRNVVPAVRAGTLT